MKDYYINEYENEQSNYPPDNGCLGVCLGGIAAIVLCAVISLFAGCSKERVITREVPVVVRDTLIAHQLRVDSIVRVDTAWCNVFVKGDTVYKETGKLIKERDVKKIHDTVYITKSVPLETIVEIEKPVIKEMPARFSKAQRTVLAIAYSILVAVLIALLSIIYRRTRVNGWLAQTLRKLIRNK